MLQPQIAVPLADPSGVDPRKRALRALISAAGGLPIIVAGLLLMSGSEVGLYWIAAGVIVSLMGGVFNAWVLLIEILR